MRLEKLYRQPGHLIRRAHQRSGALFTEELAGHDLTSVQYAALVAVQAHPGTDATHLSELIAFDRATLGGVIDRLETKGLMVRRPSTDDRRVKTLTISDAGAALLREVEAKVLAVQRRLLQPLSVDERKQLVALLQKLSVSDAASAAPDLPPKAF